MPFSVILDVLGTSGALCSLPDDYAFENDESGQYHRISSDFQEGLNEGALEAGNDLLLCASFSDCGYLIVQKPLATLHAVRSAMQLFSRFGVPLHRLNIFEERLQPGPTAIVTPRHCFQ